MNIPIYDFNGEKINTIFVEDTLKHVNGRVSKGEKYYYKGLGMPYMGHVLAPDTTDMTGYSVIDNPCVFYMGPMVIKQCFQNKYGIFQEKYQPQFSDFIGSCGAKELDILENSLAFGRSSPVIHKSVNYDKTNQQYYFILDYKCNRVKYLQDGNARELYALLEYMVANDWNFIWDKRSIEDISSGGLVTDVGDLFQSKELKSKLGTVYSVLYSLGSIDFPRYKKFVDTVGLKHSGNMSYVENSLELLKRFGVDVDGFRIDGTWPEQYKHIVRNYLVTGRNCGDCCYIELGDQIREQYITQTERQWGM
jgi:hypothetical protein